MNPPDRIEFDDIDELGPQTCRRTFEVDAGELDRVEVAGVGPVQLEVRAEKGDLPAEYAVSGDLSYEAELRCSRCLKAFPFASRSTFTVRYRPRSQAAGQHEEIEITEGELDVEFYEQPAILLRRLAVDQIQLSLPMKPLCDESCVGLCPQCGADRAREKCSCERSNVDGRWEGLRAIREELAKSKRDS
jgi:uncharacterized protein